MKIARTVALAGLLLMGLPAFANDQTVADKPQFIAEAHAPAACVKMSPITDDQRQKLAALRDKFELDTADKKAELDVSRRQLRSTLSAVNVDKAAAASLQNKINGLRDDLSNAKLNLRLAAGDVFTPEQRAAFRQMHRFGHHHGHHGFGGREGRGQSGEGRGEPSKVG